MSNNIAILSKGAKAQNSDIANLKYLSIQKKRLQTQC